MRYFIYCFCALALLAVASAQQGYDYCNGSVTLRANTGTIADHYGLGNYHEAVVCVWFIQPSSTVNSIRLVFDKFDLEYGFDYVAVRNGPSTTSPLIAWYTGSQVPTTIEAVGTAMTVIFYSDALLTGAGFEAVYYGSNCPNRCSGNGVCIQGVCNCDNGYDDVDCSSTYCYNNCNAPHGQCINDTCICEGGFYGVDCSNPYCGGISSFTGNTGVIQDHYGGGNYLDNQNCTWLVDPNEPFDSITLTFNRFDTEPSYDFVRVEDGWTGNSLLIGSYSGSNIPPPTVATSGVMSVRFSSDEGITKTGFSANFVAINCTNSCSGRGHCRQGVCSCHVGWGGEDCSQPVCTSGCHGNGQCINNVCVCSGGWRGADCGICDGAGCPTDYCYDHPMPTLTNATGIITDHTGAGDYVPNQYCSWSIQPSNQDTFTSVVLTFTDFDLDEGDFVAVYDGASFGSRLIAKYSSNFLPPPVISTAESLYVAFSSAANTGGGTGFVATYSTTTCINDCNDVGTCLLGGVCDCFLGYTGAACEQTYCPNNCTFSGECRDNMCHCDPGKFGPDCSSIFCQNFILYEEPFGIVREHSDGVTYRSNSDCGFLIQVPGASSISLVFTQFQTEVYYDWVAVYDGVNSSARVLTAASGSFLPHPVRSSGNSMYVEFYSDFTVEFTGFVAQYTDSAYCPASCNNRGICFNGTCICTGGYSGTDCSQTYTPETIILGKEYDDVVVDHQWKYYKIVIDEEAAQLLIDFDRSSFQGNPELYLNSNAYPSFENWVVHSYTWGDGLVLRFPSHGTYYFGVYGNSNQGYSNYTFTVSLTCPESCGNGACDNGLCVCNYCYEGDVCDRNTCGGFSATAAAFIAIFVIVGSAGIVGMFLWCIVRYRRGRRSPSGLPAVELSESGSTTGLDGHPTDNTATTTPRTDVTTPYASPREVVPEVKEAKNKTKGYKQFEDEN